MAGCNIKKARNLMQNLARVFLSLHQNAGQVFNSLFIGKTHFYILKAVKLELSNTKRRWLWCMFYKFLWMADTFQDKYFNPKMSQSPMT